MNRDVFALVSRLRWLHYRVRTLFEWNIATPSIIVSLAYYVRLFRRSGKESRSDTGCRGLSFLPAHVKWKKKNTKNRSEIPRSQGRWAGSELSGSPMMGRSGKVNDFAASRREREKARYTRVDVSSRARQDENLSSARLLHFKYRRTGSESTRARWCWVFRYNFRRGIPAIFATVHQSTQFSDVKWPYFFSFTSCDTTSVAWTFIHRCNTTFMTCFVIFSCLHTYRYDVCENNWIVLTVTIFLTTVIVVVYYRSNSIVSIDSSFYQERNSTLRH